MPHRDRAYALSFAVLSLTLCHALPAAAQPAPGPEGQPPTAAPEGAAALRDKARAALSSGDTAGACQLFEQSYQASKAAGSTVSPDEVLFDLADCHARQDKKAIAAAEFEQVATGTSSRAAEARARADALNAPPPPPPAGLPEPSPRGPLSPMAPWGAGVGQGAGAMGMAPPPVVTTQSEEPPTRIGDFMDTRLTWVFGDDDVLHQTGQTQPLSGNASIGDRKQYRLFFDNLNSRFAGRENLTHLVLYKKMPGFIKRLDTEASLVLRFDIAALASGSGNLNQVFYDSGSFIRAFYHTGKDPEGKTGLGVTLWPLDTDRFRLGYLYDISWGGTNPYINQSIFPRIQGSSPGGKVQYDGKNFSVYAGFKTANIVQVEQVLAPGTNEVEQIRQSQTNYGFLAGGAVDIGDYVHVDLGGGYFQQGRFEFPDVAGRPVYTFGGSGRVAVHSKDMTISQSVDFLLYRNDPNKPLIIFKPETYKPGKTTWSASVEVSNLFQNLKDFDVTSGTRLQQARAAALQANMKSGFLRASLTGIYRDLPFVMRNQPSYLPFVSLPRSADTTNELFLAAAMDYFIESLHLTPGIGAGLQFPATFTSRSTNTSSAPIERTVVVREQGNIAILPVNRGAVPIFQARASLKWDISRILSAIAWVQFVRDNNGTFVARDPSEGTVALRTFISPNFLGFGAAVQARF